MLLLKPQNGQLKHKPAIIHLLKPQFQPLTQTLTIILTYLTRCKPDF